MNFCDDFVNVVIKQHDKKMKRDIWTDSKWRIVKNLDIDDVGKIGETMISKICKKSGICSCINGKKGNIGDGVINNKSVEIKTSRLSSNGRTFQHELGETPWKSDYMLFFDISPSSIYITIFPNFTEELYKKSGMDCKIKAGDVFKTKSICWRKRSGNFKLDTTVKINEINKYTFILNNDTDYYEIKNFINSSIPLDFSTLMEID